MLENQSNSPVLVGGVGGSGTRVVTEVLMRLGFFMGGNLNASNDYMGYGLATTLRKVLSTQSEEANEEMIKYIGHRLDQIELEMKSDMQDIYLYRGWGWKVPGNFYLLEYANIHFSDLKYIHVIRHGLDMAFSSNQNQLNNWGWYFDIDINELPPPVASLRYWIEANKFARNLGEKLLQQRFHLLSFDDLIMETKGTINALSEFLEVECTDIEELAGIVHRPNSLGRYRQKNLAIFSKAEIDEVVGFGFQV